MSSPKTVFKAWSSAHGTGLWGNLKRHNQDMGACLWWDTGTPATFIFLSFAIQQPWCKQTLYGMWFLHGALRHHRPRIHQLLPAKCASYNSSWFLGSTDFCFPPKSWKKLCLGHFLSLLSNAGFQFLCYQAGFKLTVCNKVHLQQCLQLSGDKDRRAINLKSACTM